MRRAIHLFLVAAACTTAACAAAPAAAAPGDDAFVETTRFPVLVSSTRAAFARCPGGARALGGGVMPYAAAVAGYIAVAGPLDETDATETTADGDTARSIYGAFENRTTGDFDAAVSSICSQSSDATVEATQFTAATGNVAETARCPTGRRVVGGGVVQIGVAGNELRLRASGPLGPSETLASTTDGTVATAWYAAVFNGTGSPLQMKVFALCSPGSDAVVDEHQFTITGSGTLPSASGQAVCPDGRRALGGGAIGYAGAAHAVLMRNHGPLDETGDLAELADGDVARRWGATFTNTVASPQDIKVLALCASDPAPPQQQPPPGDPPGDPAPPADTRPPALTVKPAGKSRIRRNALRIAVLADEAAALQVTGRLTVARRGKSKRFRVPVSSHAAQPGVEQVLRIAVTGKAARAARKALRRGRKVVARLEVRAADASGNATTVEPRIRLRR